MNTLAMALLAAGTLGALLAGAARRWFMVAQPDEWLLRIRNGRLVDAGVGVFLWRRPGDVVVRFSSTLQRVSFAVETLTSERVLVSIEGFILWSVSPAGEAPFQAFRKLGIVNLDARPAELRSQKHLLSTPQHHAFQRLLGATVQRLSASLPLATLLQQEALLTRFRESLGRLEADLGIRIDEVEILSVRPLEPSLLRNLSAEVEERVRADAARVRLEAGEQIKQRELESAARLAHDEASCREQQIETEHALRLVQLERNRELQLKEEASKREGRLASEATDLEVVRAAQARHEVELAERLDRVRQEAEASRDAMLLVSTAEERRSPAARDHELGKLVAERVAEAFGKLPLTEARWINVGGESPLASLLGMIGGAREIAAQTGSQTSDPRG